LANLNEAGTLYGAIIYQKAPIVMRQLELMLGADRFRDGLREYLEAHAFGNASWSDLISVLDARTPEDLAAWSRAWVEEAGRVIVTTDLQTSRERRAGKSRIEQLSFTERDPFPRRGLTWTEQMQVALGYEDGVRLLPVRLNAARVDVADARGLE